MQHIRVDLGGLLFYRIGDIGNGDAAEALQLEMLHSTHYSHCSSRRT